MRKCPNCGSKYEEDDNNFCMECGSRLIDMKHKRRYYRTGDYRMDLRIAEELYQIYDKNEAVRFDNVNGRLLASQTRKIDLLIEQNNRIIGLLEKIANKH